MVVSTDLPLLEAALVLLPVAYKQLPHLELKNTLLQPAPATDHKLGDQFCFDQGKNINQLLPQIQSLTSLQLCKHFKGQIGLQLKNIFHKNIEISILTMKKKQQG
jgi:hypothetical protein